MPILRLLCHSKKAEQTKKSLSFLKLSRNSTIKKGTDVSQLYWNAVSFILLGKAKSTKIFGFFLQNNKNTKI